MMDLVQQFIHLLVDHRFEYLFLPRVIIIKRAFSFAQAHSNIPHRRFFEPMLFKEGSCRVDDLFLYDLFLEKQFSHSRYPFSPDPCRGTVGMRMYSFYPSIFLRCIIFAAGYFFLSSFPVPHTNYDLVQASYLRSLPLTKAIRV